MDSSVRQGNGDGQLNDSWVELNFQLQRSGVATPEAAANRQVLLPGLSNNQMEKLLLEAARESRGSSRVSSQASSRGSPKSPHSPNNELAPPGLMTHIQKSNYADATYRAGEGEVLQAVQRADIPTDWIWDWSSRPEAIPPSEYGKQFKRAAQGKALSVRNTKVMRAGGHLFSLDNLPTLLVTHACTFFLGAAAMFIYLKKYCNWTAVTASMD